MIANKIFRFFGLRNDSNFINGKGLLQRYNMAVGNDMDFVASKIDTMCQALNDPDSQDVQYLKHISKHNGLDIDEVCSIVDINAFRRLALYAKEVIENRGSRYGTELLTYLIFGDSTFVSVSEDAAYYTFDSNQTFDSTNRTFDSSNALGRLTFEFELFEDETPQILETLQKIADYNTPFDCTNNVLASFHIEFNNEFNNEFN